MTKPFWFAEAGETNPTTIKVNEYLEVRIENGHISFDDGFGEAAGDLENEADYNAFIKALRMFAEKLGWQESKE